MQNLVSRNSFKPKFLLCKSTVFHLGKPAIQYQIRTFAPKNKPLRPRFGDLDEITPDLPWLRPHRDLKDVFTVVESELEHYWIDDDNRKAYKDKFELHRMKNESVKDKHEEWKMEQPNKF